MSNNKPFLIVKDHSVSGEEFQLMLNSELEMLETIPQPSSDKLFDYYNSHDYISHTDSKRNWFERLYHLVKKKSLQRKLELINSFNFESKKLLDVGCGTGDFLEVAFTNGWSVFGIEPNDGARSLANIKINNKAFDVETLLKFEPESFDVITLWHVMEHLPNLDKQILNLESLLKPNGKIIIAVPNYKSFDANYYKEFWAGYDVPRHLWHFSQKSIITLALRNKLQVENMLPLIFDAFYVSLLSEKYKSGWMNPLKAFWVGLNSNLKAKHSGEYSSLIYILKKTNKAF